MTGTPFTIYDSSVDADRNGELVDFIPAGTYSGTGPGCDAETSENTGGRNGARGRYSSSTPASAGGTDPEQDARALPRHLQHHQPANFDNPAARQPRPPDAETFLCPHNLRGGGGFPRQALMGAQVRVLTSRAIGGAFEGRACMPGPFFVSTTSRVSHESTKARRTYATVRFVFSCFRGRSLFVLHP
jgi:hypothetical protein